MKIALSLVVAFATAAMLMGILGSATYAGISAANERRAWSSETIAPKITALQDMQSAATLMITSTDEYLLTASDSTAGADLAEATEDSSLSSTVKATIQSQEQAIQTSFQKYAQIVNENFQDETKSRDLISSDMANLLIAEKSLVETKGLLDKNGDEGYHSNPELLAAHLRFILAEDDFLKSIDVQLASARAENLIVRNYVSSELSQLITATTIFATASAFLTGFAGYLIYRSFVLPLKNLKQGVDKIAKGNFDTKIKEIGRNDEIGSLARAIETMETELQLREGQKDEFIGIASHELRTPIQPILGFAMLAKLGKISNDKAWDAVLKEARRLQRLSSDILDVTKIGSNSLEYRTEKINIHELLGNIVRSTSMNIKNGVTISLRFEESQKDLEIDADRSRITQVFTNIIENAKKFTEEGEIKITSEVLASEGMIRVRVIDCGKGIPEEIVPVLFKKFATKNHGQAAGQGTGLGLYISKAIVNDHGGNITARNNINNNDNGDGDGNPAGATFEITLPLKKSEDAIAFSPRGNQALKANLTGENVISSN